MDCTVVITTFFSGDKLEKCINNIDSKFNILVIDNGCEEKKKFYFEDKDRNNMDVLNSFREVARERFYLPGASNDKIQPEREKYLIV